MFDQVLTSGRGIVSMSHHRKLITNCWILVICLHRCFKISTLEHLPWTLHLQPLGCSVKQYWSTCTQVAWFLSGVDTEDVTGHSRSRGSQEHRETAVV